MADRERYHRLSPKFWTDEKVLSWDGDTRLLALYLLTCPHRTTEGLFRLPKPYILADLGWTAERLTQPFAQLLDDGLIEYDERVSVCLLVKALKYNATDNPNQATSAVKRASELPKTRLLSRFIELAERYDERLHQRLVERLGQQQAQAQTQDKDMCVPPGAEPHDTDTPDEDKPDEPPPQTKRNDYPEDFERFWQAYPSNRRVGKKGAHKAWKAQQRRKPPRASPDELIAAAERYAAECERERKERGFVMHPATFLGPSDRYEDYLHDTGTGQAATALDDDPGEVMARLREQYGDLDADTEGGEHIA